MKSAGSALSAVLLAMLLAVTVVTGCGGSPVTTTLAGPATTIVTEGESATTALETTSTAPAPADTTATTAPTSETTASSAYDALGEIRAALAASDQIADDFQITESKIVDDSWAGVVVHAPAVDDATVLLSHGEGTWSIVSLGSDLSGDDALELGAPQEIVDMFGGSTPALTLSDKATAYAAQLGGTDQRGQQLHVIVGASTKTEQEAQSLLDEAVPHFGDMQDYFVIQLSDNFDGLEPGWFVVIEAYKESPSTENLDFGRRGFPDAYVKAVTTKTSDPIPVYEDVVGG